jgi:hypothetical protein
MKQLSYPIQYWNYVLRILINLKGVSWMGHNGWIAQKKISLEEQFQHRMVMVIKANLNGKRSDKRSLSNVQPFNKKEQCHNFLDKLIF